MAGLWELPSVEVVCVEGELRRIQPEIVENVRFRRIEHAKCAAHHGFWPHRPGESEARRPVVPVEFDAGVRHCLRPIGGNHDSADQVEVAHPAVGGRSDLVSQAEIHSQVGTKVDIVLRKSSEVPIPRRIQAQQIVLFVGSGNA